GSDLVDGDEVTALRGRDGEHHRYAAPAGGDDPRVGVTGTDADEPVHDGVADRRWIGGGVVGDGQQVHAHAVLLERLADRGEEGDGVGVPECVGERLGVHDADGVGPAVPQGAA